MDSKPKTRAAYCKPRLRKIQLVSQEVLGTGCKTGGLTNGYKNNLPCIATGCNATVGT